MPKALLAVIEQKEDQPSIATLKTEPSSLVKTEPVVKTEPEQQHQDNTAQQSEPAASAVAVVVQDEVMDTDNEPGPPGIAEVQGVLEAGSSESIAQPGVSDHSLTQQAGVVDDSLVMPSGSSGVEPEVAPEINSSAQCVVEQTSNVVLQQGPAIDTAGTTLGVTDTMTEPVSSKEQRSSRLGDDAAPPSGEEEEPAPPGLEPEQVNHL